ncbi:MAG TPA: type II toxin-antitoxin system HicA family toxin, partial [Tepidisphaeraceae bacterium]|nr:type II toxin-antitoxin system HicA family toxin [Tepidisphaeraceae bacterium]
MYKSVRFSELCALLQDLGFTEQTVRGSHRSFFHKESDSLILLPLGQWVRPPHLQAIARTLDERG